MEENGQQQNINHDEFMKQFNDRIEQQPLYKKLMDVARNKVNLCKNKLFVGRCKGVPRFAPPIYIPFDTLYFKEHFDIQNLEIFLLAKKLWPKIWAIWKKCIYPIFLAIYFWPKGLFSSSICQNVPQNLRNRIIYKLMKSSTDFAKKTQ